MKEQILEASLEGGGSGGSETPGELNVTRLGDGKIVSGFLQKVQIQPI